MGIWKLKASLIKAQNSFSSFPSKCAALNYAAWRDFKASPCLLYTKQIHFEFLGNMRVSRDSCKSFADPKSVNILVVEDNVLNQKVLKKLLMHIGYSCDVANN